MTDDRREFVLAAIRAGIVRVKLFDAELSAIGVALKAGLIDCETAMEWVRDIGALELVRVLPDDMGDMSK